MNERSYEMSYNNGTGNRLEKELERFTEKFKENYAALMNGKNPDHLTKAEHSEFKDVAKALAVEGMSDEFMQHFRAHTSIPTADCHQMVHLIRSAISWGVRGYKKNLKPGPPVRSTQQQKKSRIAARNTYNMPQLTPIIREWIAAGNDTLPIDEFVVFVWGYNPTAVNAAVSLLRKEGYGFERCHLDGYRYYKVTARPSKQQKPQETEQKPEPKAPIVPIDEVYFGLI